MEWLINNWTLLVAVAAVTTMVIVAIITFVKLPVATQINKIKEWLLLAVIEAEKEFSNGTGKIKLRSVYSAFIGKFKLISCLVSFETFSKWVDEALDKMKEILDTNKNIEEYVKSIKKVD